MHGPALPGCQQAASEEHEIPSPGHREVAVHALGSSQPPISGQSLRGSGSVQASSSPSSAGEMVMLSHLAEQNVYVALVW